MGIKSRPDIRSLASSSQGGYLDVRREFVEHESFRVRDGRIEDAIRGEQSGTMARVAGDHSFLVFAGTPESVPIETKFSKFVVDQLGSQSSESFSADADGDLALVIPQDVIDVARAQTQEHVTCQFLWRRRQVEWANSLQMKRKRVETCQLVRVDLAQPGKHGEVQLRKFVYNPTSAELDSTIVEMKVKAKELTKAKIWSSQETDVILAPSVSAVFVHEVFGHPAEWDRAGNSGLFQVGKRVASAGVSVEDQPQAVGAKVALAFDDEGIDALPVRLIDRGVVVAGLNSLESAFRHDVTPNGRALARDFRHRPISRMTNIRLEPGNLDSSKMIEGIQHGLYLVGSLGAIVSPTSFGICCQYGYEIRKGKLENPILRPVLSGEIGPSLAAIRGVGNSVEWVEDGGCLAENQFLQMSGRGAPDVFLSKVFVG